MFPRLHTHGTLIEMGCDLARSYDIARMHQMDYIGVDIRKNAIEVLAARASRSNLYSRAIFVNDNALNVNKIFKEYCVAESAFCLLPFNLVGNFANIDELFAVYGKSDVDVVVSSWSCSHQAVIARSKYYTACGLSDLDFIETGVSHCFKNAYFHSEAFDSKYLSQVAEQHGFHLLESFETNIAQCLYFSKKKA